MADNIVDCVSPAKVPKLDISKKEQSIHHNLTDLSTFCVESILHNNSNRKSLCLLGTFTGSPGVGIVLLEKTSFEDKTSQEKEFLKNCELKQQFHNDIYGNYNCTPHSDLNVIKTTVIHPATDKHIEKFRSQIVCIVNETPQIYKEIVLPHITNEQLNLQWVYNILDHISEVDRIVYEDPDPDTGFILLPDLKWDGKTIETLYLLAIVKTKSIKSLRDLHAEHLSLLKNILTAGVDAINKKYGLDASRLRIYVHYQPSFYHFHVHFTYLQYDAPGIYTERSHMLANVISNIELLSDYYQKVTIPFTVRKNDKLFKKLEDKDILSHNVGEKSSN